MNIPSQVSRLWPESPLLRLTGAEGYIAVPLLASDGSIAGHIEIIAAQRQRLGTKTGFIAVKPNCSIQSYVPAVHAVMEYKPLKIVACTYQAISGAGKTFEEWPEMVDNIIPYIGGEEEKSEQEPLRIWGTIAGGAIVKAAAPVITTQPASQVVSEGSSVTLTVVATGTAPLNYQWSKNGIDIAGKTSSTLSLAAMLLGILAASRASNADMAQAAIVGGQAAAAQAQLNFSRDMEREADDYAIERLHDAGLPITPLADLLEKMEAAHEERTKSRGGSAVRLEGYLSTHPGTAERVQKLRGTAP